ncbi:SDR family oxidoreductase [Streptosporangiaceae bacterium NEAU-GS5]|nr:SDR family oxidoreductase [Streptosporangiaceae bacterium NEAU-GS5]
MTILITGADGYLGRHVTAALRRAGRDDLLLAVRARDAAELAAKRARLGRAEHEVIAADLREPAALSDADPRDITTIIHAAATIRFDVDRETAERVNVHGTTVVRDFARRCPKLERFAVLSTLYAAGRHTGEIPEARLGDAGFVNHYEWSKWAAEEKVLADGDLPVTVLRLPTVVANDETGWVTQRNVFHKTLKLYYRGLLSLLPGDPATPLSLATARFTVEAIVALLAADPGVYHVSPEPASLRTAIDTAFTVFERDPAFRLPRPVVCDRDSFLDLLKAAEGLRGSPLGDAIAPISTFAEQLYLPKSFSTERMRAAWPGYRAADPTALIGVVCARLTHEWGGHACTT